MYIYTKFIGFVLNSDDIVIIHIYIVFVILDAIPGSVLVDEGAVFTCKSFHKAWTYIGVLLFMI